MIGWLGCLSFCLNVSVVRKAIIGLLACGFEQLLAVPILDFWGPKQNFVSGDPEKCVHKKLKMTSSPLMCSFRAVNKQQWWNSQYNTIQYNTIQSIQNTIQYNTIQYNTITRQYIQYSTVQTQYKYNTIQYSTVQYSTVQYSTVRTIQYNTIHTNTIQYKYNTIQYNTIQYIKYNSKTKQKK